MDPEANEATTYELWPTHGGVPVKSWTRGVPFEEDAKAQLRRLALLPFIHRWVAVMPDVHLGIGATVGSVIPMKKAIIPAAVGVDIGCGMIAARTSLVASDLPDTLAGVRSAIEAAIPHGRTQNGGAGDVGAWRDAPTRLERAWAPLARRLDVITERHPSLQRGADAKQLGTLGSGNHFVELCLDESDRVWLMLHSGSRGAGNRIGRHFIELAKSDMRRAHGTLPHEDLAYFEEGTEHFDHYVEAVSWAQDYARLNRELMMQSFVDALRAYPRLRPFEASLEAVNCHHNYVVRETHYGEEVMVARKGAVRARKGELGIIPGSMGARSHIVRGLGNEESFCSCSHGAGRTMSRTAAKQRFTLADHIAATADVECRKDADVIDETPGAYKSIDAVMAAQRDLVEIVYTLRQVICIKG